jgi:hypothetical protein
MGAIVWHQLAQRDQAGRRCEVPERNVLDVCDLAASDHALNLRSGECAALNCRFTTPVRVALSDVTIIAVEAIHEAPEIDIERT